MLNSILAVAAAILLILCMLCPQTKKSQNTKWLTHHTVCSILLIITALLHGILAGKHPAMFSGKLAWILLVGFAAISIPHRRFKRPAFKKIHRSLAIILCAFVFIHIVHALVLR